MNYVAKYIKVPFFNYTNHRATRFWWSNKIEPIGLKAELLINVEDDQMFAKSSRNEFAFREMKFANPLMHS